MDDRKIKHDIYFYFWIGVVLYVSIAVLNIIHLYQWKGREWVDFFFHLVLLSINISLISKIKEMNNSARKLFIIKSILFMIFLYPMLLIASEGGWVYSGHWPHGVLQRIGNMSVVVYEVFMILHLRKRAIRFVFTHHND